MFILKRRDTVLSMNEGILLRRGFFYQNRDLSRELLRVNIYFLNLVLLHKLGFRLHGQSLLVLIQFLKISVFS